MTQRLVRGKVAQPDFLDLLGMPTPPVEVVEPEETIGQRVGRMAEDLRVALAGCRAQQHEAELAQRRRRYGRRA